VPYAPLGGPIDYVVLRRSALPALRRAVARSVYGPMAVAFALTEEVFAAGGLVAHRNTHGLDPTDGIRATVAERERDKLTAWGALLGEYVKQQPPLRAAALLGLMTAGGLARAIRPGGVPRMETSSAVLRGYAAAVRR
jgi:hypothetical protein